MAKVKLYLFVNPKGKPLFFKLNNDGTAVKEVVAELPKGWKVVDTNEGLGMATASGKSIYYLAQAEEKEGSIVPVISIIRGYDVTGVKYLKVLSEEDFKN